MIEYLQNRIPVGSTSLESLIASDVAISWFAGVMAKIMQFGCNPKTHKCSNSL